MLLHTLSHEILLETVIGGNNSSSCLLFIETINPFSLQRSYFTTAQWFYSFLPLCVAESVHMASEKGCVDLAPSQGESGPAQGYLQQADP